jgi:GGDEF domain-containing protein
MRRRFTPALRGRLTRRAIAHSPHVWRVMGVTFLAFALVHVGVALSVPEFSATNLFLQAALVAPAVTSVWNHVFVALGYLLPFGALWAAAPHAEWMIGAALFAPLGIVARLVRRPLIVGHLVAATVPSLALAVSGAVDPPSSVALGSLVLVTWIVGASAAAVFAAGDQQWAQVVDVVGRDPLTGAATAALFEERLEDEAERHRELQLAFLILELDLDDFEAYARSHGRVAATACLRSVTGAIGSALGPDATVARIEGSRFRVLVPFAGVEDGERFIDAIEQQLERVLVGDAARRVRSGYAECVGGVTDPADAVALASQRRGDLEQRAA